jgi:transcriptional regulator with XRE-family HTH domain
MNKLKPILTAAGIRIKDLADECKISSTTISKAVNNKDHMSETLQNRVVNGINKLSGQNLLLVDVFPQSLSSDKIKIETVFKRAGVPAQTFVKAAEYDRLLISLRDPGRCVIVEGPSGAGKTTSVKKALEELNQGSTYLTVRQPDDIQSIRDIAEGKLKGFFVIDDFHRLDEPTKAILTDRIKLIADIESPEEKIVICGINKVERSLYEFSPDLVGRIDIIFFEPNNDSKIREVITKGEKTLNIVFKDKDTIVKEATGSFQLAQMICHDICVVSKVFEEQSELLEINFSLKDLRNNISKSLYGRFNSQVKEIAQGPKLNENGRAPYLNILEALKNDRENWSISIDELIEEKPSLKDILEHIVKTGQVDSFLNNPKLDTLLYYDPFAKTVTIEDAKFIYYLRSIDWQLFPQKIGFKKNSLQIDKQYDIAISFAGADRVIADKLYQRLIESELSVFYDFSKKSEILGQELQQYFRQVYGSDSFFIVPIFSKEYSTRIWTFLEAQSYEHKIDNGEILPIMVDDMTFTYFDKMSNIGNMLFLSTKDIDGQVENIAKELIQKVGEKRLHS